MSNASGKSIYERYGVKPIINAAGVTTRYGGTIMEPEVVHAMEEASRHLVDIDQLNRAAGELIARATGAEAGLVSAGSSSGMTLQAAACMTATDLAKISRLPDSSGMKNEIVMQKSHRLMYDHAYRAAGAKIVEMGNARETMPWELEAAINENTAAVGHIISSGLAPRALPLDQVIDISHKNGVRVIVDAAGALPPPENLQKFTAMGADMVVYSGGKGIMAPQSTGVLCGTKELIEAATLNFSPNDSVGRGMKVCKEEIIGLMTALELYLQRDHEADMKRWRSYSVAIADALAEVPGVKVVVDQDDVNRGVPTAIVYFTKEWSGPTTPEVVAALRKGEKPVYLRPTGSGNGITVNPHSFQPGGVEVVIEELRRVFLNP